MRVEVKAWEELSSKELRQDSMKRGLPEACDRQEVLLMRLGSAAFFVRKRWFRSRWRGTRGFHGFKSCLRLKLDLTWEHMVEDELREECLKQGVALPEPQEGCIMVCSIIFAVSASCLISLIILKNTF